MFLAMKGTSITHASKVLTLGVSGNGKTYGDEQRICHSIQNMRCLGCLREAVVERELS